MKQSVYFRVPNDIADMLGVDRDSDVTLVLEETGDEHLLVYRIRKVPAVKDTQITPLQSNPAISK